jgi:hypothetical protein
MKLIAFALLVVMFGSTSLFASSLENHQKNELVQNDQVVTKNNQNLPSTIEQVKMDVELILSKNARIQKRSSSYIVRILNDQINWNYRSLLDNFDKRQEFEDFLRYGN